MAGSPIKRNIGGIVGGAASGKDCVAAVFADYGFQHISTSDVVREEIAMRGLRASRPLQTAVANELRRKHGAMYWVERSLEKAATSEAAGSVILSGIYAAGEGLHIKQKWGGFIVAVTTGEVDDCDTRYKRLVRRADGDRDRLSHEEFVEAHVRENAGQDVTEANIGQLSAIADYTVVNNGSAEDLRSQTIRIIEALA